MPRRQRSSPARRDVGHRRPGFLAVLYARAQPPILTRISPECVTKVCQIGLLWEECSAVLCPNDPRGLGLTGDQCKSPIGVA